MIDLKLDAGFTEIYPPFVTRKETLVASAHLPHFDENLYRDDDDDIWLIPTAEPQLVSQHRDETIPLERLPLRYVAYTACFRREKMSAGRDVRGIKRGHQFDKVEMVSFTLPEESPKELDRLTQLAVDVVEKLELPVRLVERCAGDLGFTAMKGYDVETWGPGVGEWLEVSSTSDGGPLQAERGAIRFKRDELSAGGWINGHPEGRPSVPARSRAHRAGGIRALVARFRYLGGVAGQAVAAAHERVVLADHRDVAVVDGARNATRVLRFDRVDLHAERRDLRLQR
jgi:seryl-tRNA synthetase